MRPLRTTFQVVFRHEVFSSTDGGSNLLPTPAIVSVASVGPVRCSFFFGSVGLGPWFPILWFFRTGTCSDCSSASALPWPWTASVQACNTSLGGLLSPPDRHSFWGGASTLCPMLTQGGALAPSGVCSTLP